MDAHHVIVVKLADKACDLKSVQSKLDAANAELNKAKKDMDMVNK